MIIKPENEERLKDMLSEGQERARVRKVDYKELLRIVKEVNRLSDKAGLSDSAKSGLVCYVNPYKERFASAYRGAPEGTVLKLSFFNGSWRLVDAYRDYVDGSSSTAIEFVYTEKQKATIIDSLSSFSYRYNS